MLHDHHSVYSFPILSAVGKVTFRNRNPIHQEDRKALQLQRLIVGIN